jgi:acyl-CoA reductase-like NAD-dependent aldehyde dehydrogenase
MANATLTLGRSRGRGLASYFYSRDIGRIWRVAERLEYGTEESLEVKYLCMGGIGR